MRWVTKRRPTSAFTRSGVSLNDVAFSPCVMGSVRTHARGGWGCGGGVAPRARRYPRPTRWRRPTLRPRKQRRMASTPRRSSSTTATTSPTSTWPDAEVELPISRRSSVHCVYRVRFASAAAAAAAATRLRQRHPRRVGRLGCAGDDPARRRARTSWLPRRTARCKASVPPTRRENTRASPMTPLSVPVAPAPGGPAGRLQDGPGRRVVVAVIDTASRAYPSPGTKSPPGYNFVADNDNAGRRPRARHPRRRAPSRRRPTTGWASAASPSARRSCR